MAGGIAWTAGAKWATQLFSWAALVITARLLSPADYGVGEMAGFFFALTNTMAEFGVGTAALHLNELDDVALHQLHGFSLLMCTGVYIFSLLVSPLVASFFHNPALIRVIEVSSLTFFITGFQAVPTGLLQRDMDYKRLSMAEAAFALVQSAVTVAIAWAGYGYWALIWGVVAGKATNAAMVLMWKPLGFSFPRWKNIRAPLEFGRHAAVGNLATTAYYHSDVPVISRMMGAAPLGTYRMALYLASAPAEKISTLIMRTAGPLFANVQSDLALARRYFLLFVDTLAILLVPAMIGLIMVAPDAVRVILAPADNPTKWDGAIKPLIWLSCYMIVSILGSLVTQVLTSRRMTKMTMRVALINLAIMPVAFIIGARLWGTTGVAAAWLIASPLTALPSAIVLLRRIELGWRECLSTLWPTVSAATAMVLALLAIRRGLSPYVDAPIVRLVLQIVVGATVYSAVLLIFFREKVWRYVRFAQGFRSVRAGQAAETGAALVE